jgi:hypothetical protein
MNDFRSLLTPPQRLAKIVPPPNGDRLPLLFATPCLNQLKQVAATPVSGFLIELFTASS